MVFNDPPQAQQRNISSKRYLYINSEMEKRILHLSHDGHTITSLQTLPLQNVTLDYVVKMDKDFIFIGIFQPNMKRSCNVWIQDEEIIWTL